MFACVCACVIGQCFEQSKPKFDNPKFESGVLFRGPNLTLTIPEREFFYKGLNLKLAIENQDRPQLLLV